MPKPLKRGFPLPWEAVPAPEAVESFREVFAREFGREISFLDARAGATALLRTYLLRDYEAAERAEKERNDVEAGAS